MVCSHWIGVLLIHVPHIHTPLVALNKSASLPCPFLPPALPHFSALSFIRHPLLLLLLSKQSQAGPQRTPQTTLTLVTTTLFAAKPAHSFSHDQHINTVIFISSSGNKAVPGNHRTYNMPLQSDNKHMSTTSIGQTGTLDSFVLKYTLICHIHHTIDI